MEEATNTAIPQLETWVKALTEGLRGVLRDEGVGLLERKHAILPGADDEKKQTKEQRFQSWFRDFMNKDGASKLLQRATLVEGSGSGSYIVPTEFASEVAVITAQFGKARQHCRRYPSSVLTTQIPDLTAHVTVTVPGENTAFSESIPTIGQKTLTLKFVGGIAPMSNEVLMDNNVGLLALLARSFGYSLGKWEDQNAFGGGTSFTPMLALSGAQTQDASGTSLSSITADDLQALRRKVSADYWPNAKFFMSPQVLSYLEQVKDQQGRYIVRMPVDVGPYMLWGHEVVQVNGMPATDAAATAYIGFADPSFCYFNVGAEMTLKLLEEATLSSAGNLAEKNLSALRVAERFGVVWTNEAGVAVLKTAAA